MILLFSVCLLLSSLITGGDLSLPGQRVVALALIFDFYKVENPFSSLFLHLLEGKPGLLPLAAQERLFIGQLHGFVQVNIKDVSNFDSKLLLYNWVTAGFFNFPFKGIFTSMTKSLYPTKGAFKYIKFYKTPSPPKLHCVILERP